MTFSSCGNFSQNYRIKSVQAIFFSIKSEIIRNILTNHAEFKNKTPIEQLNYKILKTKELFAKDFKGAHEATRYIYILLNKVLSPKEFSCLKQYNLSYRNSNEFNLMAIYAFDNYGLYYSFSNELGFTKVSPAIISNLLKNGWKTNSKSIQEIFDKPEQDKINRQK